MAKFGDLLNKSKGLRISIGLIVIAAIIAVEILLVKVQVLGR